ncbi:DUF5642 family protein [Rhodococcus globerulus]|uniref:PknH-like protein n=2 Tax=Nocardiaceae TaxID=85025 RepID=A0A652YK76_NOCGL|nr:hypothetical protein [Rhodococcus globerulus]MDV6265470.1 sensor domain-containing protein [Rhodococcus globerulus]NMD61889.1 sensor domain-containing protein [Nocardia globerula]PVX66028.1 hypothetical protein C8E04_3348 [Rhodococcus globerulus]
MVGRGSGRSRLAGVVAVVAALGLLSGCSSSISGEAQPDAGGQTPAVAGSSAPSAAGSTPPSTTASSKAAPLADLLLTPAEFPPPFDAVVLPAQAVPMAAPDLVGVPRGATVDPADCAPPEQDYGPTGTVMAVGTDNASRSTISVELTRSDTSLTSLEAQTEDCTSMKVTANGVTSTVTTVILPPSPINADQTLSLRRTVSTPSSATGDQTMLTLMAQVGDVRIAATLMTFGATEPSTAPLDEAFTAAVQKVRAGS